MGRIFLLEVEMAALSPTHALHFVSRPCQTSPMITDFPEYGIDETHGLELAYVIESARSFPPNELLAASKPSRRNRYTIHRLTAHRCPKGGNPSWTIPFLPSLSYLLRKRVGGELQIGTRRGMSISSLPTTLIIRITGHLQ